MALGDYLLFYGGAALAILAPWWIVKIGGKDLALRLEDEGYGPILREAGLEVDLPDEALKVPTGPELELEPVEAAR